MLYRVKKLYIAELRFFCQPTRLEIAFTRTHTDRVLGDKKHGWGPRRLVVRSHLAQVGLQHECLNFEISWDVGCCLAKAGEHVLS